MAADTATLTLPHFLAASGPKDLSVQAAADGTPANPFLSWFGIDEAVLRAVMAELTSRGADAADLYFQYARINSIALEDGIISRASSRVDQGVGLRVVIGDQVGFAITEDLTKEAMLAAAKTAAGIASGTTPATVAASFRTKPPGHFYEVTVPWSAVGIDRKLPILERAEALVRAKESAIDKVSVTWSDVDERILVADLRGNIVTDHRPMHRLWVSTTASKNGVTQANGSNLSGRQGIEYYSDDKLGEVAQQAIDRTMVLFDARRPPSGEMPVILTAGASGILLHEAIGHGMEADFNRKNTSMYSDMIGKKVAPDFVTIVDDGTLPGERGALNYDDEGNACERTTLVENGVLRSYLHDDISARHYGVASTGSGRRESFRFPPMPRMRCTYMENGPHSKDEIVGAVEKGIIAETFTNGQVQIGAGDFTFYVKNGWLIEGGRITAPIKDCNIIGNGPDVLKKVSMAAADSKLDTGGWTCGKNGQGVPVSQGLPTVLVSSVTVGGTHA